MNLSKHCKIPRPDYQSDGHFWRNGSAYDTALGTLSQNCTKVYTTAFILFQYILSLTDYQNLVVSVSKSSFEKS